MICLLVSMNHYHHQLFREDLASVFTNSNGIRCPHQVSQFPVRIFAASQKDSEGSWNPVGAMCSFSGFWGTSRKYLVTQFLARADFGLISVHFT